MAKRLIFAKLVASLWVLGVCVEAHAWSEVICAGNIPPEGLVVTATGTAPTCNGACRARKVQPVYGEIMKICSDQPIPKGYVLDGITSTPACRCLGADENAYIIKRRPLNYGYDYDQTLIPAPSQTSVPGQPTPPSTPGYSYPYPYPNQAQNQASPYGSQQYQVPYQYQFQLPPGAPPPGYGYPPGSSPSMPTMMGNYPPYEQEPMRIGE